MFAFLLSTALALYTKSIVDFVKQFLPLTMSGLAVIVLLGRFWKRATWQGALAALITTPVVSLAVMKYWDPTLPATLAGALALAVVSPVTPPKRRSFEEVAEAMTLERQSIEGRMPRQADLAPAASSHWIQH